MSRIGYKPVAIPQGVEVVVSGNTVKVKGPKGELTQDLVEGISVDIQEEELIVNRGFDSKRDRSMHGLYRSLIINMIEGVTEGYEKKLLIEGTGYRAAKNGNTLTLNLGFSHPIELEDPAGLEVEVPVQTEIIVRGIDKQLVGAHAAKIRDFRRPEPYKGKGVRYSDERIRRKVGKTGS